MPRHSATSTSAETVSGLRPERAITATGFLAFISLSREFLDRVRIGCGRAGDAKLLRRGEHFRRGWQKCDLSAETSDIPVPVAQSVRSGLHG